MLKALAREGPSGQPGLLPARFGVTNRHHTPVDGVVLYAVISAAIILIASGQVQELVLVYAVAVFVSFLAGLAAMARFSHRRGSRVMTATNLLGAAAVAFTLVVNTTQRMSLERPAETFSFPCGAEDSALDEKRLSPLCMESGTPVRVWAGHVGGEHRAHALEGNLQGSQKRWLPPGIPGISEYLSVPFERHAWSTRRTCVTPLLGR